MLFNFIVRILNLIIKGLGSILSIIVGILPSSPFQAIDNSAITEYIGALNWIIPVGQMLSILQAWVTAIAMYYLYMVVGRWLKLID